MRKSLFVSLMPIWALVLVMNVFSSCGKKDNSQSAEDPVKAVCSSYLSESGDEKYLASDFRAMVDKYNAEMTHELWTIMWNTGSDVDIESFEVADVADKNNGIKRVTCVCHITDGADLNRNENFYFDVKEENGKWVIYDIEKLGESAREFLIAEEQYAAENQEEI